MSLNNYKKILLNLLFYEKTYRTQLLENLKITPSTLSYLLSNLSKKGYISIFKDKNAKTGRPKHLINLNKNYWKSIGVRVGREHISLTVFNGMFEEEEKITIKLTKKDMGNKNISNLLERVIKKVSSLDKIKAIGIAFSGNVKKNKVNSKILKLEDFSPKPIIDSLMPDVKLTVLNDVEAIATEEFIKHGGKKIVVINYGTGIGACFYESHGLYERNERKIIELGHFYTGSNEKCYCGSTGCLETVASDYANLKRFKNKNLNIEEFIVNEEIYTEELNELRNLHKKNPKKAEKIYEDTFNYLAIFLLNIIRLLEPEKIILSGEGVSKWFSNNLERKILSISSISIPITYRGLENNIELGAAIDATREYILKFKI